jgi:hypothetical protein
MEIVDGTKARPIAAGTDQDSWDQGNNEAQTTMLLSMSDAEVEAISGCSTAHEIWNKLSSMYQSISGESKQALWQKYYSIMASPDKSPIKTMVEIQSYASQLRSMGVTIDEEMEVARIVSSLMDEKYRQFREAWRSVDLAKQTSALLLSRLKTWELEEEAQGKTKPGESSKAFQAGKRIGSKPKSKEELAELKKRTKCHICKEMGHWRSECPTKKKGKGKPDPPQQKSDSTGAGAYMAGSLDNEWILDSGANRHYCGKIEWFHEYEKYSEPKAVAIADNSRMCVVGVGKVRVKALIGTQWIEIEICNVEHVPGGANLFSENILLDKGLEVKKDRGGSIVYYRDGKCDVQAERRDGLQIMKFKPIINRAMVCVKQATWHERLAHINCQYLKNTADMGAVYGLENMQKGEFKCEVCAQAKSTKQSYKTTEKVVQYQPGECLHSDLGYATAISHRGNKYFLVVKDAGSGFRQVYCQKSKDETVQNLKDAVNFISNQSGNTVKMFRSDNGTEYVCNEFKKFLSEKGIEFGLNAPYTSQSNGFVEREMRIEQDAARAMMVQSQLSEKHWDDAIRTACYILNRTLSSKNKEMTPFEMIFKKKPSLHHVRVFGCKAYAHIMEKTKKWNAKAIECVLVGYSASSKNYVLYVPSERRYIEQAKHVDFMEESKIPNQHTALEREKEENNEPEPEPDLSITMHQEVEYMDEDNLIPTTPLITRDAFPSPDSSLSWAEEMEVERVEETNEGRPQRNKKPVERFQAGFNAMSVTAIPEPPTYRAAIYSRNAEDWKEAMDSEIRSQHENSSWHLVKRPLEKKVLKCRWVYKVKTDPEGKIEKFKARLVVKGYNQVEGLDYEETFAPVCRYETIRMMISCAVQSNWVIKQFDIATAFLNSPLEEETFMEQPEGYVIGSDLVCKLEKGLYGLKQAPRAWHKTMSEKLEKMGFKALESDSCVYRKDIRGDLMYIVLYVDDGLLMGRHASQLSSEIEALQRSFKVSMQPLNRFLGIEIMRTNSGIFIHQKKYIEDTLERFGMSECKTLDIPMQPGLQLEGSKPPDTNYEFQELIGSLLFLARCTRPDITYAVHYLSRFFGNYGKAQWDAAKKILQYLKGTASLGILYVHAETDESLCGYVDADYGSDKQSRKSTTGCLFTFNNAPIAWISKRQTCIALSSTESEYIALAHGGKEAVWITRLYEELGMLRVQKDSMCLKTDSQSAMKLARNPEYHDKTKHIDIRHHYIRWLVESEQITLEHLPDVEQPADLLTKSVVKDNFLKKREIMGMQFPPKEPGKRSALSSVITDPKRPNLFWSLVILMLSMLSMGIASDTHTAGNAVIWRKGVDPVIVGFNAVTMKTKLVSPCNLIPLDDVEPRVGKLLVKQCQKAYQDLFLSKLESMCPMEKELVGRKKRVVFLAIGFVLIVALASAGIGLAGYAVSRTYEIETRQDELKKALDELEVKVFTENKLMKVLQTEIMKVASQVDVLINDFHVFKEKVVELQYLVAYLTSKLMEGRKTLKETDSAWKKGKLTEDFFEYLNFTLPCKEECPVEYGIFNSCLMSKGKDEILLDFSIPKIDKNLTRVEADPFNLMFKNETSTCNLKYTGPIMATISIEEDCVYETHNEKPRNNLELATLSKCRNSSSFRNVDTYFRKDKCKASAPEDEKEFIQVKFFDREYHVYCPGTYYSIGIRQVKCPLTVFTLPLSITFTLNDVEYKGNILKVIYREREDPFLKEHINWHLKPHLNWSSLVGDLDDYWTTQEKKIKEEAKDLKVFEFNDKKGWTLMEVTSITLGTILAGVLIAALAICIKKRKKQMTRGKPQESVEGVPLQTVNHHIVVEG